MKKILFSLLSFLLLVQGVGVSAGAAGLPLHPMAGPDSARQLGEQIQNTYINSPQHENGVIPGSTCTTPQMEYDALRRLHPEADITSIGMAADYLKNLKPERFKDTSAYYTAGNIRMTWIDEDGVGICHLRYRHDSRTIGPNDWVFVDPNTNEVILADCGNFTEILLKTIAVVVAHPHPTPAPVAVQTAPPVVVQQQPPAVVHQGLIPCTFNVAPELNYGPRVLPVWFIVTWPDGRSVRFRRVAYSFSRFDGRDVLVVRGVPYVSNLLKVPCNIAGAQAIHLCFGDPPWPPNGLGYHFDMDIVRAEYHDVLANGVIFNRKRPVLFPKPSWIGATVVRGPVGAPMYGGGYPPPVVGGYAPAYPYSVVPQGIPYGYQPNGIQGWFNAGVSVHLNLFHPRYYPHPIYPRPPVYPRPMYPRPVYPIPGPRRPCNLPPNPVTGQPAC